MPLNQTTWSVLVRSISMVKETTLEGADFWAG